MKKAFMKQVQGSAARPAASKVAPAKVAELPSMDSLFQPALSLKASYVRLGYSPPWHGESPDCDGDLLEAAFACLGYDALSTNVQVNIAAGTDVREALRQIKKLTVSAPIEY